jgi:hypothetical protein
MLGLEIIDYYLVNLRINFRDIFYLWVWCYWRMNMILIMLDLGVFGEAYDLVSCVRFGREVYMIMLVSIFGILVHVLFTLEII